MLFLFFAVSLASIYSTQINRSAPAEISPVVETTQHKTVSKNSNKQAQSTPTEQLESENEENNIEDLNQQEDIIPWEEQEDFSDEELYEEIVFQDNFDKEYRNEVGDSYFEDLEDSKNSIQPEDSIESNDNENKLEDIENIEIVEASEDGENVED